MNIGDKIRKTLDENVYKSVIWKSVFRHGFPDTDRNRTLVVLSNIFLHLHPAKLKGHAVRMRYTWCMGGLSFFMFLILTISGVFLMFYYRPTPEYAFADVVALREDVPLGMFMRNIHRWGAHAMVIVVWLHMMRVFLTGSYKAPREFNWGVGVILLTLTLLLSFTGYLLPWDQIAIWAITVGTNMARAHPVIGHEGPGASLMNPAVLGFDDFQIIHSKSDIRFLLLGGSVVGPPTLLRFYVLHCVFFPVVAGFFMAVHFWRIRKDGFSSPL